MPDWIWLLLAALFGAFLTLAVPLVFLFYVFRPFEKKPQHSEEELYIPVTLPPKILSELTRGAGCTPEGALNAMLQFIFQQSTADTRWLRQRMANELAELLTKTSSGKLFESLTLRSLEVGSEFPSITNLRLLSGELEDDSARLRSLDLNFDLAYDGNFRIDVDAVMLLGKIANISITVESLSGNVRVMFRRTPYTHWAIAFETPPKLDLRVRGRFQGRQLKPRLASLVAAHIQRAVAQRHTLPNYKIRYKPFFPKSDPGSTESEEGPTPHGRLTVRLVEMTRLHWAGGAGTVRASFAVDSHGWVSLRRGVLLLDIVLPAVPGALGLVCCQGVGAVLVDTVVPMSPAYRADLRRDDVVLAIDNKPVNNVAQNPIWTDMRHQLSPMFTSYRLKLITELMNVNAQHLVEKIKRDYIDNKEPVNLKNLFTMYTSDTVAFSVFGIRTSALSGEPSPLWDQVAHHMLNWTYWRGFDFMLIWFMPFFASIWRTKFFSKETSDHISKMFWDTVKEREKTGQTTTGYKDLVNHLLILRDNAKLPAGADAKFANDLMMAQVAVFVFGAVETSSTILSYALHELAHHPEEQKMLHDELDAALEENGDKILQYDQLNQLKFLNACIYETARKYPPVPHLDRMCTKRYKLDDKLIIEPGTPVLINLPAIHHNERTYEHPEQWNPHRPLPTSDNDTMQYNFLPFGDGPKFCIGKRYGMMQVRAALAQIMSTYRVEPGPVPYKLTVDPNSIIMYPQEGGSVKFFLRN